MTTPTKPPDEFDAIRIIYETLKPFPKDEQERLLRWVQEKLGLVAASSPAGASPPVTVQHTPQPPAHHGHGSMNIKSFMDAKSPKSDNQFAAAVAYYYRFEAPDGEKRDSITKDDLVDACRKTNRKHPSSHAQVLVNAHNQGLLDKEERGQYRINSVGENLVGIVLPNQDGSGTKRPAKKRTEKRTAKKAQRSGK